MNGIRAEQQRTIPRHINIIPYDREEAKRLLQIELDQFFSGLEQIAKQHPLLFCRDLDNCLYATANCLYGIKKCYNG